MFEPLSTLFTHSPQVWSESDIRYAIQDYLQTTLMTDQLVCVSVVKGVVEVRVGTPVLHQEVKLLEYDLVHHIKDRCDYEINRVRIIR